MDRRSDASRTRAAKLLDGSIRARRTLGPPGSRVSAQPGSSKNTLCIRPIRASVLIGAVAAILGSASPADTATCLPSPAEVRKQQPKAWPRWTRRVQGKRCWFAGRKPVFTKGTLRLKPARQPTANAVREWDLENGDPIWQTWSMEYRWDHSLAAAKPAAPR